ncbi:Protein of unknown function DUF789 - like 3 [Theobroma cacao]|nr:Protein of unknown function DUF789 - like 3 [Theobroma cacao]
MLEKEKLPDMMSCLGEDIRNSRKGEISLPPFAMVAYKMSGALWINPGTSDQDSIICKQTAARLFCQSLCEEEIRAQVFSNSKDALQWPSLVSISV